MIVGHARYFPRMIVLKSAYGRPVSSVLSSVLPGRHTHSLTKLSGKSTLIAEP